MKIFIAVCIVLTCSSVSICQTKNGFRGYPWGTRFAKMKDKFSLSYHRAWESDSSETEYGTNIDKIANIPVKVSFYFLNNRFHYVVIYVSEIDETNLVNVCIVLWGSGRSEIKNLFNWNPTNSKDIGTDTEAYFTPKTTPALKLMGDGFLMIRSISIDSALYEHNRKLNEKNRDRLRKEF